MFLKYLQQLHVTLTLSRRVRLGALFTLRVILWRQLKHHVLIPAGWVSYDSDNRLHHSRLRFGRPAPISVNLLLVVGKNCFELLYL